MHRHGRRLRIGYSSAALLIHNHEDPEEIRRNIEASFGQFQNRKRIQALEVELSEFTAKLQRTRKVKIPCCTLGELLAYQAKRRELEELRRELQHLRGAEHQVAREEKRRRIDEMALAISEAPCHRCPERRSLEKALKREQRLLETIEGRTRTLEHLRNNYWEQFLRVVDVLRHFEYLKDGLLTSEGLFVAGLRHDNELLVARVVFSGLLQGLRMHEVVALLSCLVEEPREGEAYFARQLLKRQPHLRQRVRQMEGLAQELMEVQRIHRVFLPISMHTTFLAATYEWAAGEEDWVHLVQGHYGGHEGDMIRAFRRLIDLCRQLLDAAELPGELRESLARGVKALDRGIVYESALI